MSYTEVCSIHFRSPINRDNGYSNTNLSEDALSEMRLYVASRGLEEKYYNQTHAMIEWEIEELEEFENIGLILTGNVLTDYDGVFELPPQAVGLLLELGYTIDPDVLCGVEGFEE